MTDSREIVLSEIETRDILASLVRGGHWSAVRSEDGKRLTLRYRGEPVHTVSDLIKPRAADTVNILSK